MFGYGATTANPVKEDKWRVSDKLVSVLPIDVDSCAKLLVAGLNSPKNGVVVQKKWKGIRLVSIVTGADCVDWLIKCVPIVGENTKVAEILQLILQLDYLSSHNNKCSFFIADPQEYYKLAPFFLPDPHIKKYLQDATTFLADYLESSRTTLPYVKSRSSDDLSIPKIKVVEKRKSKSARTLFSNRIHENKVSEQSTNEDACKISSEWRSAELPRNTPGSEKRIGLVRTLTQPNLPRITIQKISKQDIEIVSTEELEAKSLKKEKQKMQYGKVIIDYEADDFDEITLVKGEIIEVHELDKSGWWTGLASSGFGLFPFNYISLLSPGEIGAMIIKESDVQNLSTNQSNKKQINVDMVCQEGLQWVERRKIYTSKRASQWSLEEVRQFVEKSSPIIENLLNVLGNLEKESGSLTIPPGTSLSG